MVGTRAISDGGGVRRPKSAIKPNATGTGRKATNAPTSNPGWIGNDPGSTRIASQGQYYGTGGLGAAAASSSGGGSYGGGSYGGNSADLSPMVTAPSEEDYLAGDAGYTAELSALQGALQRFLADSDFQRTNYSTDYQRSLRDLGYDEGSKQWNFEDPLTASGRGYNNQLNDFASRGMLQSQGYADAYNELLRMLGQQYDTLSTGKNTFMTDMDNQTANFKAENTANQQAARAQALQRRAAQFAL